MQIDDVFKGSLYLYVDTWVLQVGTQSVKIHVLVAVSLSLLLHHHQIPGGQALQISSPSLVG